MITVAVIDDGIFQEDDLIVKESIVIDIDLKIQYKPIIKEISSIHGTTCARIIKKYYEKAQFVSIEVISDRSKKGDIAQLVQAIKWCINNKIRVINMSIGSIRYNDYIKLNEVVNSAYENGIIIVAACSNDDVITYPASLSNVIGVKCLKDTKLSKNNYIYSIYSLDGIDIMASSKHKISDSSGNVIFTEICNSFATPMITAKVCAILEYNPKVTLEEIKLKLYMNSSNYIANENGVNRYRTVDWINKYTCMVTNKNYTSIFDENISESIKRNCFKNGVVFLNKNIKYKEIYFLLNNKNIKVWDSLYVKKCYENSDKIRTIDIPIVLICDYTNNMLLSTLEDISNKFKENGYYCVTACTETKSILYGCEYIPMDDDVENLERMLQALYYAYDCDVLILGINIIDLCVNSIKQLKDILRIDQTIILIKELSGYSFATLDNNIVVTKGNSRGLKNNYSQRVFDDTQISLLYEYLIQRLI